MFISSKLLRINILLSIFYSFLFSIKGNANAINIDDLYVMLHDKRPEIRLSAIEELGKIKNHETVKMLMAVVEDRYEDWKIRGRAIRLLGEIKDPIALNLLINVLKDIFLNNDCPALKWNTVKALGNFKNEKALDALIEELNTDSLTVKEATIYSLGEIGHNRALPHLISLLNHKSFAVKRGALISIRKIGNPEAIPFLRQLLEKEDDQLLKDIASATIQLLSKD